MITEPIVLNETLLLQDKPWLFTSVKRQYESTGTIHPSNLST